MVAEDHLLQVTVVVAMVEVVVVAVEVVAVAVVVAAMVFRAIQNFEVFPAAQECCLCFLF